MSRTAQIGSETTGNDPSGSASSLPAKLAGYTFLGFVFSSAFSIAAAQICLGLALVFGVIAYRNDLHSLKMIRPVLWAALIYVGWRVLSSLTGPTPVNSLWTIREDWLFLIVPLTLLVVRKAASAEKIVGALSFGLVLAGVYGVVQHFTGWYFFHEGSLHHVRDNFRLSGNFSHPLTYGYYVVVSTLFLSSYLLGRLQKLRGWQLYLPLLAVLAGLAAAGLCNSRGPFLALGVGLALLGIVHKRVWLAVGIVVVLAVGAIALSPGMATEFEDRFVKDLSTEKPISRSYIWGIALEIVRDEPILGTGPGNFGPAYIDHLPEDAPPGERKGHAHNDYLQVAATVGIPGLLLYLVLWAMVLRILTRTWWANRLNGDLQVVLARAALIASTVFLIASAAEAAFADDELRQLLMALWGLGLSGAAGSLMTSKGSSSPDIPNVR